MIAAIFPIIAFFAVFVVSQRSLTYGVLGTIAIGYISGIVRANYQSIATTFFFDAAVGGLYFSLFFGHVGFLKRAILSSGGQFCLLLILWPVFLTMLPVNNFWVQLVALRSTIWLLPFFIIANRFEKKDLLIFARGFAVLNLMAMVVGLYIFAFGVERLYPKNEVTRIIYNSKDAGSAGNHRVPSTFLSAHAYGNTMVLTIPLLVGVVLQRRTKLHDRTLIIAGVFAAIVGILLCAARQPIWVLGLVLVVTWVQSGLSPVVGIILALLGGSGIYLSNYSDRLQRGFTLEVGDGDYMYTFNRIYGSVNEEILENFLKYPFGAGMGSSVGTSLPYFLADYAPEAVGHENEYSRIQVDQGWIGLGLWLAFLFWTHFPRPVSTARDERFLFSSMHSTTGIFWATAFIGTGTLASIPGSAILLLSMGILVGQREAAVVKRRKERRLRTIMMSIRTTRFENLTEKSVNRASGGPSP